MPREVGSFFILITVRNTFCQTLVISLLDGNEIWFRPWWKKRDDRVTERPSNWVVE